jgi:molecular chaperone GrpE (heat shock protein)
VTRDAAEQRLKAEREAERRDRARQAAVARETEARTRQQAIERDERAKQQRKTLREREKRQHERAKRRAAFLANIRRRLGLEVKQAPR